MAADPDGRVGALRRFGQKAGAADVVMPSVKLRFVGSPQLLENLDVFVGDFAALGVGVQPQGLELLLHPAHAAAEDEPPGGEDIQGGEDFGGKHRVAVGEDEDMSAEADAVGAAGQEVERRQGFKVGVVVLEGGHAVGGVGVEGIHFVGDDDVVADPDVVVVQGFGGLGQAAQVVGGGHSAPAGQGASESNRHGKTSIVVVAAGA